LNPEELYEKVQALHREGYGSRRIAKMLGVDRKLFERWIYPNNRGKLCKPRPEPDLTPSRELAYVIGARLGDGTVTKYGRHYAITLKAKDKDFVETFHQCLAKVSRRKVHFFQCKGGYWQTTVYSKPLFSFLKSKNIEDYITIIESFPEDFIRGFADAEGSVNISKKYHYVRITLDNTDFSLLNTIRKLLLNSFNIHSKIRKTTGSKKTRKIPYRLEIWKQRDVAIFAQFIGFTIKRKAGKLRKVFIIQSRMLEREELYKQVLTLHKEGLGYRRIAKKLKIPIGTVESWIARGHKPWGIAKKIRPIVKVIKAV